MSLFVKVWLLLILERLRLARHILPSIDGKIASFLNGLRRYLTSEDGKLALTESCDSSDLFAPRCRCNKKQSTTFVVLCFLWSGLRGSNPPPSPWQGDALPNELNPHIWCLRSESNQRHGDFQSPALPTELQRHLPETFYFSHPISKVATRRGLEPLTSSVTG